MTLGVRLHFALSEPRITMGFGKDQFWKLSYKLLPIRFMDSLELSSGGDVMQMPGYLHISGRDPSDELQSFVGAIHHLPLFDGSSDGVLRASPESYSVECAMELEDLKVIIAAERAGSGPNEMAVNVIENMAYGWAPDGSIKTWDVSQKSWAAIDGMSLRREFVPPETSLDDDEQLIEPDSDPTGGALHHILMEIRLIRAHASKAASWVIGILLLIACFVAFR